MAHIPGPNFIGYKPEWMADNWHPVQQPPKPETSRNKGKGKRTAATQLKPYWRTNYPTYSVWDEGTPATSIPSLVKRPRSARQSNSSSGDNYPAMREALNKPPMGPPLSKARKAKAHFYRMKAGEGASDLVQYHPTPGSSKNSGVVEAEVSPPKDTLGKTKGFSSNYMKTNPMITKEELNEGLQSDNEAVRAATLKLNMLIHSGRYTKDQALQMEQTFLEVSTIDKIKDRLRFRPVPLKMEIQHPSLQEILLALESTSPMYRKKANNVYRISQDISDEQDPFYQEAVSRFYSSQRDYLEALRLIELGVLDTSSTNLDQTKGPGPKINGTMTIADDLFQALGSDDPHLKACANAYYEGIHSRCFPEGPQAEQSVQRL